MSNSPSDRDYVLGTHDEEIARLGLQHRVWRQQVLAAWQRAGIKTGSRVLDVGAGPGFATRDLAEIVGPEGRVAAVERSGRFAAAARARCAGAGAPVEVHELDLMPDPIPVAAAEGYDFAWCRWVASFVASPATLCSRISSALRPGGRVVFHEYLNYGTWSYLPGRPRLREFVQHVMASWRASGGEPDIAGALPALLAAENVQIIEARPLVFAARPNEGFWSWPAAFIEVNLARMQELGRVDAAWAEAARAELRAAGADPASLVITPMVLELIAEKRG